MFVLYVYHVIQFPLSFNWREEQPSQYYVPPTYIHSNFATIGVVHHRFLKFSLINSEASFVPSSCSYWALNVVINVCHIRDHYLFVILDVAFVLLIFGVTIEVNYSCVLLY